MHHPFYKGVVLGSLVAAVVLLAGTALAGTGPGASFTLGKLNVVNRTSTLSGRTGANMLTVANKGTGTALSLKVADGSPPLAVSSSTQVADLNADMTDGTDVYSMTDILEFTAGSPYLAEETLVLPDLGEITFRITRTTIPGDVTGNVFYKTLLTTGTRVWTALDPDTSYPITWFDGSDPNAKQVMHFEHAMLQPATSPPGLTQWGTHGTLLIAGGDKVATVTLAYWRLDPGGTPEAGTSWAIAAQAFVQTD